MIRFFLQVCRRIQSLANVLLGALLLFALAPGCASPKPHAESVIPEPDLRVLEAHLIAIAGEPIVIPVASVGGPDPAGKNIHVELEDGRRLKAELHRLSTLRNNVPTVWLANSRFWRSGESNAIGESNSASFAVMDVVVVDLPEDADGLGIRLTDHPLTLDWRDPPGSLAELFTHAPAPPALNNPKALINLYASLSPALKDPLTRWRGRLLADRLRSAGFAVIADRIDHVHFDSVALEALADQIELRWRLALDRLNRADPFAASHVAQALTRLVVFDDNHVLPAWSSPIAGPNSAGLNRLLMDLLDSDLGDQAVAARAQAWLAAEPTAISWVIDDAGASDPSAGFALVKIGVSDLAGNGGIAQAQLVEGRPGPRFTLAPAGSAAVVASAPLNDRVSSASISVGAWTSPLTVIANPVDIKPPGARLSPFFTPWSLPSWRLGSPTIAPPDHATTALLQRRTNGSWELYLECRTSGDDPPPGDSVRLWFGPSGRPTAIIRIDAHGFTLDETTPLANEEAQRAARQPIVITKLDDRWICTLPIPNSLIEPGGYIRIGVERRDESGARSTWPRPVLPWIDEPGRAILNMNVWMDR